MAKDIGRFPPRLQLPKRLRDWLASPEEQALCEQMQRLKLRFPSAEEEDRLDEQLEQSSAQPEQQPLLQPMQNLNEVRTVLVRLLLQRAKLSIPPGQKRGGGREPILTDEEDAQVGTGYWSNPPQRVKRTQAQAFEEMRDQLPKDKREISDSALRNCIRRHRPQP